MTLRRISLAMITIFGLVAVPIAQPQKNVKRGALVDKRRPAVFISYLRSADLEPLKTGYGRRHLLFKITNNTQWPVWLEMNGVPNEYGDAGLFYTIESRDDGKVEIDSRCHVCSVNPLSSGRSVVFSIPADYVRKDARLRIAYSFAWERDNEAIGGSHSTHSVEFYFSYLPESVLPSDALSNKRLQPTPR
jgi:hypothetical protein